MLERGRANLRLSVLVRYVIVGGGLNLLAIAFFALLFLFGPTVPPIALNIMVSIGLMPLSYAANRFWVFNSREDVIRQSIKFMVVYLSSIIVGNAIMWYLLHSLAVPPLIAQIASVVGLITIYFLIQACWTFRPGVQSGSGSYRSEPAPQVPVGRFEASHQRDTPPPAETQTV